MPLEEDRRFGRLWGGELGKFASGCGIIFVK
jgi:hypothetical protein